MRVAAPAYADASPSPPSPPFAGLWDAYGIGANDVANAFSTSVNSGVFTMAQVGVVVRRTPPLASASLARSAQRAHP